MSSLEKVLSEWASTMATGSAPGKPPLPHIATFEVGTVVSANTVATVVEFPSDPGLSSILITIPYLGAQPSGGDLVLVVQLPHQRVALGVISH